MKKETNMHHITLNKTEKLIDLVQKHPVLYDRRNCNYRRVDQKINAWHKIAATLNLNETDVKKTWRSLRDQYSKVLRQSIYENSPSKKIFKYFDRLSFLKEDIQTRSSTFEYELIEDFTQDSNANSVDNVTDEEEGIMHDADEEFQNKCTTNLENASETPPIEKRRKKRHPPNGVVNETTTDADVPLKVFLKSLIEQCGTIKETQPDTLDRFFQCMAAMVREAGISGKDLLQLKCNVMNHLVEQISQHT